MSNDQIRTAVEDLILAGTTGFYASAIVNRAGARADDATNALIGMADAGELSIEYDVICPDNGRLARSYADLDEVPFGNGIKSGRCEDPEQPFVVEETDVMVRFVPAQPFTASILRKRKESATPGKAQAKRGLRGLLPRLRVQ